MKTFAIIVLLTAVKTLNSSAGIKFNIPGDNFNIPQGRQTHYPEDNIPELKFCRPEAPCQYGEGDCTRHGDDGCDSDLVCGVNNCGDFVPGMAGSCCVQLAGPSISSYRGEEEPGEFKTFPVETVPGGWSRWTAWSQTLAGWGRERRRIATAGDGDLLAHLERQMLD